MTANGCSDCFPPFAAEMLNKSYANGGGMIGHVMIQGGTIHNTVAF